LALEIQATDVFATSVVLLLLLIESSVYASALAKLTIYRFLLLAINEKWLYISKSIAIAGGIAKSRGTTPPP
jgi:hypothetical protein